MYNDAALLFAKLAKDQFDWESYYKTGDDLYKQQHTGADVFDPKFPDIPKFGQDGEYNPDYLTAAGIKVQKSGNMTAREGHFMAEKSKLRSTIPSDQRAGAMTIDLDYGDKPRYDDSGNIKSPYMFEQEYRANAPTDVFDKMDYDTNFTSSMTAFSTDKPETPVSKSLETNNDAALDLQNTIVDNEKDNKPINNQTNNQVNNQVNNEVVDKPVEVKNEPGKTSWTEDEISTIPKVEEPKDNPTPPTNTSKDLNEQAQTNLDTTIKNEELNNPTETSKDLNEEAKNNLDNSVQTNNDVTNNEPSAVMQPANNKPASLDVLRDDFKQLKSTEGKVPATIATPSSYEQSLGDKREYAKRPNIFKGGSWLPSFIDELKKITL